VKKIRIETVLFLITGVAAGVAALTIANRLEQGGTAAPAQAARGRAVVVRHPFTIPTGNSVIARALVRRLRIYAHPHGSVRTVLPNPNPEGGRVLLVKWTKRRWTWPAWVRVYLPVRPNGRLGWIRSSEVKFFLDPLTSP
jgi:hypothetical protein